MMRPFLLCGFLSLSACLFEPPGAARFIPNDSGVAETPVDAFVADAKPRDSGSVRDTGERFDGGVADTGKRLDTGLLDRGNEPDAEPIDVGFADAEVDAGAEDTGVMDAIVHADATPRDSGVHPDAAPVDTGVDRDLGFTDAGTPDTGTTPDSGVVDASVDAGPRDVGIPVGYVVIPAGSFLMGSPPGEPDRIPDEDPRHLVTITRPFLMKQTEITRGEWSAVMGSLPSQPLCDGISDDCPVTRINRDDLIVFVNELSRLEGLPACYTGVAFSGLNCRGYRLPTEAEWEYAARAGTTTPYPFVPGSGQTLGGIAWYDGNSEVPGSGRLIHQVRLKAPNGWGLYDIIGNAIEVLHGRLTTNYFGAVSVDPEESGATPLSFWNTRGCCFNFPASDCRSATRGGHPIGRAGTDIHGGRPVRTMY